MAKELSNKERIEALSREERNRAAFAAVKDALSLIDLTQNKNLTYTTYSRESLRSYLKNPASETDPWYYEDEIKYPFSTPEYVFEEGSLQRLNY